MFLERGNHVDCRKAILKTFEKSQQDTCDWISFSKTKPTTSLKKASMAGVLLILLWHFQKSYSAEYLWTAASPFPAGIYLFKVDNEQTNV